MLEAEAILHDVCAEADSRLERISAEEGARILFAAEAGSRAWGYPSADSDYDLRFLYVRPLSHYLAFDPPRDVIERPLDGLWDVRGWDLAKALKLMLKGHPVVSEWLNSPIVYREAPDLAARLTTLLERNFDVGAAVGYYSGLLTRGYVAVIAPREQVALKNYFYALRAAAALAWLREHRSAPPIGLSQMLAGEVLSPQAAAEVGLLRALKRRSSEMGVGPRQRALDAFIQDQLDWAILQPRGRGPSLAFVQEAQVIYNAVVMG